ncbi:MAG: energy-coupling factor transporter transmembrane protein EcfT [Chloroflexi bacterium]|nr:energy-coupling factor transporter transmembrane protein EcfT [Chloroflexota bacterium]
MSLFEFYETASPLHRLNPMAKFLGVVIVMAGATLYFDPFVPATLAAGLILTLWILGRVPLNRLTRWMIPVVGLGLPLAIFNALYYDVSRIAHPTVIGRFGLWLITAEGAWAGAGLGVRVACFIAASMFFVVTTDPTDFALSLIQQAHLPYRFGYGVLVSYRFLPLLRAEFDTIRAAHRVRGVGERAGLRGRLEQLRRYAIPLLAGAIRHSERTALAMDSKAFGAGPGRTYRRNLRVRASDWAFVIGALVFTITVVAMLGRLGLADLQLIPAS